MPRLKHLNIKLFIQPLLLATVVAFIVIPISAKAQTDLDAIMMSKNNLCAGGMYGYSSWNHYWEGTLKRDNANIGTVSSRMVGLMGTYGISGKLNLIVGAPYVENKASAGTLHSMKGFQDFSFWAKWMPVEVDLGAGVFSVYTIGGFSIPMSNYIADYLPLSIGLQSKTLSGRLLLDYQVGNIFATASGTYTFRSDITIDQTSYYTTQEIQSNKVYMPNMASYNIRAGYRSDRLIAEVVYSQMNTLGGFDIRRNDMPFPSNKMNATTLGVNCKYNIKQVAGLSVVAGGNYTLAGRNVGQATSYDGAVFYILDFSKKTKKSTKTSIQPPSKSN